MLKKLYHRVVFCWRDIHHNQGFTSYRLITGRLRVIRCLDCHRLLDVAFSEDQSESGLELSLEPVLSKHGYPAQERFR